MDCNKRLIFPNLLLYQETKRTYDDLKINNPFRNGDNSGSTKSNKKFETTVKILDTIQFIFIFLSHNYQYFRLSDGLEIITLRIFWAQILNLPVFFDQLANTFNNINIMSMIRSERNRNDQNMKESYNEMIKCLKEKLAQIRTCKIRRKKKSSSLTTYYHWRRALEKKKS